MVTFNVPDDSSEEDGPVENSPSRKVNLPVHKVGSRTVPPKRKGILKSASSFGQHRHHVVQGVGSSASGTFKVPSAESSPCSTKGMLFDHPKTSSTSPPTKDIPSAAQPQPSTPRSSPHPPRPLFSPQFDNKGARRDPKPDPFPLRGNQVTRVKKRVFNGGRGRYVLHRAVPKTNTSTEAEMRATKRLLSHPGLIRLLDCHGFEGETTGTARSNETFRETVWDHADLGTLQTLLDREQHSDGLPENFVWHVLLSLLKTALYLHTGYDFDTGVQHGSSLFSSEGRDNAPPEPSTGSPTTSEPDVVPAWQPIIHNLIDPWNISFYSHDEQDPPGTPRFPHVKLGNLSRVTLLPSRVHEASHEDFPPLPKALQTNFQAPEVAWEYEFGPQGAKSDLWSIAAVAVVMMGGIGGIAGQRKVKIWNDVAQRYVETNPCSDEALYYETSRMIKAGKWRWSAAELNQKYPGKYSVELRCFLERLLTVVPKQRPDTLEAVVWASNYHLHWLRSVNAPGHATVETGVDMIEMEEDADTQSRIDRHRRVGGTTPMQTPSPQGKVFAGEKAPLGPQIEQVELPNLDAEVESEVSSEEFNPGPPAHLLHELTIKKKAQG